MPELPEVETVMRGLAPILQRKKIVEVKTSRARLRLPYPKNITARLTGETVLNLERRAKYILAHLSNGESLIIHLGMSGRMTINPDTKSKHDHFSMTLSTGDKIVFNDPRRFGLITLCTTQEAEKHKLFAHLGPEPLDNRFDAKYLQKKLAGKTTAIKVAIMDQQTVVGVGNIYASEALHLCHIDPRRAAKDLSPQEATALVRAIRATLKKAIEAGGSSLRDYRQADGELGYFQHNFRVYDRAGDRCKNCKSGTIERMIQSGRATYFCPACQK